MFGGPTDTEATPIPGVVAAGAKVHVIKDGFSGSEGTLALPGRGVASKVQMLSQGMKERPR